MSSPGVVPTRRFRRSFAGPIVLIVIGLVFLLRNMGYHLPIFHVFARWWPLLIILWGLVKLIEYFQARREGYPPPGIGAGGVVFLIFLVMLGIAASQATRVNWNALGDEMQIDQDVFTVFGSNYNFTDELQQPFPADASLRVVSDRGRVTVNSWDQKTIKVSVQKRVIANNEPDSRKINESSRPIFTQDGRVLTLNANTGAAMGGGRVQSDLEIYLPKNASVEISTKRGDIVVHSRLGDIKASSTRGDIDLQDVTGNAALDLHRGSLKAARLSGDLSVEGRLEDTDVSDIGGSARFNGEFFGQMNLSKIAKSVSFKSSRTQLDFARLDGDLKLDSGDLRATSAAGPLSLTTRSKDIHLEDISGDLRVENSNGAVEVRAGKLPLGSIEIGNRKGDIEVILPARAAFQLDARTRRGDIRSEFGDLKLETSKGSTTGSATVGSGGPRLQINSDYGNIDIRKAG